MSKICRWCFQPIELNTMRWWWHSETTMFRCTRYRYEFEKASGAPSLAEPAPDELERIMTEEDPYRALGVIGDTDPQEIALVYRDLVQRHTELRAHGWQEIAQRLRQHVEAAIP